MLKRRGFLRLLGLAPVAVVAEKTLAKAVETSGGVQVGDVETPAAVTTVDSDGDTWVGYDAGLLRTAEPGGYLVSNQYSEDLKNQLASDCLNNVRMGKTPMLGTFKDIDIMVDGTYRRMKTL